MQQCIFHMYGNIKTIFACWVFFQNLFVVMLFLVLLAGVCKLPARVAAFQPNAPVRLWHRCLQPPLCFRVYQRLPQGLAPLLHTLINETGMSFTTHSFFACSCSVMMSLLQSAGYIRRISATHVFIPTPIAKSNRSNSTWRIGCVMSAPMPRYISIYWLTCGICL